MKNRLATLVAFLLPILLMICIPAHADYFKNGNSATLPSPSGQAGKIVSSNGSAFTFISPTTAGCTNCVTTEVGNITGVVANDNTVDNGSKLLTWMGSHSNNQIVHVTPGTYYFRTSLAIANVSNIEFRCDPGAIFQKVAAMDDDYNEYFLEFITASNIKINGCRFEGLTTDANTVNPGEQGIVCYSCHGFYVSNNYFHNLGDGAVRSTTSPSDSLDSNSTDTWITNNIFDNVAQVTTTPAGSTNTKAATSGYWVLFNKFYNLKWSLKACTRSASSGIHIVGNEIQGNPSTTLSEIQTVAQGHGTITIAATGDGVEICSVSDLWVEDNNISGTAAAGITAYTNPGSGLTHFDYGDYQIKGNIIKNTPVGIRVANDNYVDGVAGDVSGISITDNTIKNVTGVGAYSIIMTGVGGFHGSSVMGNRIISPTSGLYMTLPGTGVTSANNVQN